MQSNLVRGPYTFQKRFADLQPDATCPSQSPRLTCLPCDDQRCQAWLLMIRMQDQTLEKLSLLQLNFERQDSW